jgi:hypothetical protein
MHITSRRRYRYEAAATIHHRPIARIRERRRRKQEVEEAEEVKEVKEAEKVRDAEG